VLGLLTWVAQSGSVSLGLAVFLALSLGLGTPLLALALLGGRLDRLPRAGEWLAWVRRLMGWVLVGVAVRMARPLVPPDVWLLILLAAGLAAAVDLGWRTATAGDSRFFSLVKTAVGTAGLLLVLTIAGDRLLRGPEIAWRAYTGELVAAGKPVIIDFSAAWCAPCRSLEEETFRDRRVTDLAASAFVMLKVDLTRGGDPAAERLVREYGVSGVPTIVFLGADGREHRALRLFDHLAADDFLARMQATQVLP
jgi:thiol:disulfide interchange protein DsbD